MDLIVKNVSEAGEPVLSLVEEKCLGFFVSYHLGW